MTTPPKDPKQTSLADDISEIISNEINGWKAENQIVLDQMPQTLIDSAVSSAIAAAIPKAYLTPQLANIKMQYAAEALKCAADMRNQTDVLQAQLKDRLMIVIGKILIMIVAKFI